MNRRLLGFVILISLSAPAVFAQGTLRCESDYGRRHECTFSGWGRVGLSRQLSHTACVEGRTWGTSGRNTIWVSDGCRADFVITRNRDDDREHNRDDRERARGIACTSNGGRVFCSADTHFGVHLNRQFSSASCVEGRSWGYNDRGIWVDRGCSAEFLLGNSNQTYRRNDAASVETLVCESDYHSRHHCAIDTRFGVRLSRQLSRTNCVFNHTWGYDGRGIGVADGCRAEFLVGR